MSKQYRTLAINAETREVKEVKAGTLKEFQALVGGYIARGLELPNGDEVFVNDEGLLGSPEHFFYIDGAAQPFAGNAYVTGATTRAGNSSDAKSEIKAVFDSITWLTRADLPGLLVSLREKGWDV